jgi:hypothetical protein
MVRTAVGDQAIEWGSRKKASDAIEGQATEREHGTESRGDQARAARHPHCRRDRGASGDRGGSDLARQTVEHASGTITCGLGDVPPNTSALLCGGGFRGGHAVLGKTGRSTQVVIRQHEPFTGTAPGARLAVGSTWSLDGVSCTIAAKTVTCRNRFGHGFTISSTRYKNF